MGIIIVNRLNQKEMRVIFYTAALVATLASVSNASSSTTSSLLTSLRMMPPHLLKPPHLLPHLLLRLPANLLPKPRRPKRRRRPLLHLPRRRRRRNLPCPLKVSKFRLTPPLVR